MSEKVSSVSSRRTVRAPLIRPYMPELESLRGIACLAVLLLHSFSWRYSGQFQFSKLSQLVLKMTQPGWMGVNLFFVLSGFLITGILLDSKHEVSYYKPFYIRRALRILPACYALLFVLLVFRQAPWSFVVAGVFYLANLTNFIGVPMAYGPLWSLAVEEHYYLIWPLAVRELTVKFLCIVSGGLFVGSAILRGVAFYSGHPQGIDWYTWFVSDGLAAGSLLAILLRTPIARGRARLFCGILLATAIAMGLLGAPFGILTRNRLLGAALQFSVIHISFAGLFVVVSSRGHQPVSKVC